MSTRSVIALTFVGALLIPTLTYRFGSAVGLESGWLPAVAAFLIGAVACWLVPNGTALLFLAFLVGVPLGIFLDVLVDDFAFSRGRNLFPMEMVFWSKFFLIPGLLGVFLGRAALAMRDNEKDQAI